MTKNHKQARKQLEAYRVLVGIKGGEFATIPDPVPHLTLAHCKESAERWGKVVEQHERCARED